MFEAGFSDRENLFSWLLSMGDQIELLEPEELRKDMEELALGIYEKYSGKRKGMFLATSPKEGYNKTQIDKSR